MNLWEDLKKGARHCEFGAVLEKDLVEQLGRGLNNKKIAADRRTFPREMS